MKGMKTRIAALFCALAVLLSLAAAPSVTASEDPAPSPESIGGSCGEHVTWKLDAAGTLTISGTGLVAEFGAGKLPWYAQRDDILSVVIEDGVANIPEYAFSQCSNLTSVTIPTSVGSIGPYAFRDCVKLLKATIPDSVAHMGAGAFQSCKALESLTLSANLTSLPDSAFLNCSSLDSVCVPKSVTEIGYSAFYGCKRLISVVILGDVSALKESTFQECTQLQYVTLPATITGIWASAFQSCAKLTEFFYTGSREDWSKITINAYGNNTLINDGVILPHINYDFPLDATRITLDKTAVALNVGDSETVAPTFYPAGTEAEPLRWSSSDSSLAEVSDGKILAKKAGAVTITAATLDGRISASCSLTVTAPGAEGVFRIDGLSVLDSDGAELSTIPTGEFLARVSVTNETSSESPLIFFAAYSESGQYQGFMHAYVAASPGATVSVTLPVDNAAGKIARLKAFAVTSFAEMAMLGEPVSFPAA